MGRVGRAQGRPKPVLELQITTLPGGPEVNYRVDSSKYAMTLIFPLLPRDQVSPCPWVSPKTFCSGLFTVFFFLNQVLLFETHFSFI